MREISVLIGGKAGDGINQAGILLARLFSNMGYFVYMYFDYPSLIRGGHNFALIRASEKKISAHRLRIDYIIAINQDTVDFHKSKLRDQNNIIYDSDAINSSGQGLPLSKIIKEEGAKPIMRNSILMGAFARAIGIDYELLEGVIKKNISKELNLNLKLSARGYKSAKELLGLTALKKKSLPVLTGNEVFGLGLISAGLEAYVAYPMTPSSNILHFLASAADNFNLKVVHPESEIGVILMALGFSYKGRRVAVGTSGGGFCLMTEALSMAGMAELPLVIIVAQRAGPSTGIPTYTAQCDLHFVLSAGHGEFPRFVVAPGDSEEAYYWSNAALNISWKYQIPSIILSDKVLSEGAFSFDRESSGNSSREEAVLWKNEGAYKRYLNTDSGISPLAFAPNRGAFIKVNSYEHDEYGITTEDPKEIMPMYEKRLRKEKYLAQELIKYDAVKVYGNKKAEIALLCWGSNKGACIEVAESLGLKVIQPVVFSPFPRESFSDALKGVKKIIDVENNATAQLAGLIAKFGIFPDEKILKYDGRPFTIEELEEKVKAVIS
ncbi:MAG: pyruvate ferredoxin oxidoreductase [Candidatus Omnitrophica bacterium CG11_big_fil_rev_8_21_14_0_20_42_13]|uniref:Pyruvate ferredoxin oxidoreductase n=1 Tax=Candidatus Ghiorseimicrobium undicola TaxID=1974746 RepID=A0A2H0LZ43_9BACT|nr:MAG: pyruvate ferredoxin oxidoreductase [Candidatus Omnitrophica bacterium CG11_big_fil_rev_8_21_14_0_20_42_13]